MNHTTNIQAAGLVKSYKQLIDGDWRDASGGEWIDSENPYTGKVWARIPHGTPADANAAVEAAYRAFRGPWSKVSASDRGLLLMRLAELIHRDAELLADIEVQDNGKLRAEMLGQMRYIPRWFQYYGGLADKIEGSVTPIDKPGMFHYIEHVPVGVVAAITPWNSPILLTAWKLAPALAAGNTIVVKPSEFTSVSLLALAKLFDEAGFPKGVVNVVTGYGNEVGEALISHPKVARIAFTGGDAGGRRVAESAAKNFKRISLELGGKSPNIVFDDADIDSAVRGVVSGIFAATGQTCMAGSRALVHRAVHDEFVKKLVAFVESAKLGDPTDPDTNVGPMATRPQLKKVLDYIEIAKADGAQLAAGGTRVHVPGADEGFFVAPTIFTGVRNDMRIAREEVFGPILSIIPFETDDEAAEIANDTEYGLAAGIWTKDLARAINFPKRLEAGTVWVNAYRAVSYMAPFGGFKSSGIGRENGVEAIKEYLETRSVFINTDPNVPDPFKMR